MRRARIRPADFQTPLPDSRRIARGKQLSDWIWLVTFCSTIAATSTMRRADSSRKALNALVLPGALALALAAMTAAGAQVPPNVEELLVRVGERVMSKQTAVRLTPTYRYQVRAPPIAHWRAERPIGPSREGLRNPSESALRQSVYGSFMPSLSPSSGCREACRPSRQGWRCDRRR